MNAAEDRIWSVLILNDDITPMDFVVDVIEPIFDMDLESTRRLMLRGHNEGTDECGTYSHKIAKAKAMQMVAFAENAHPLQCVISSGAAIQSVAATLIRGQVRLNPPRCSPPPP